MFRADFPSKLVDGRECFDLFPALRGVRLRQFREQGVRDGGVEVRNGTPMARHAGKGFIAGDGEKHVEEEIVAEVVMALPIVLKHLLGADDEFMIALGYDEPAAHFDDACIAGVYFITEKWRVGDVIRQVSGHISGGIHPNASI